MFKNVLTTALRNLWRHKIFTLINISGLSIGISAALVIYLIVQHELSFDNFHKDGDRIYRIVTNLKFPGLDINNSGVPVPLGAAVRNEIPHVEAGTSFIDYYEAKVEVPATATTNNIFRKQKNIVFADQYYFDVFKYEWLAGSPSVLSQPFSVVISETRAKTYFNTSDYSSVIGRAITYNDSIKVSVGGVVKSFSKNTDFTFHEFISFPTIPATNLQDNFSYDQWGSTNSASQFFVRLAPGASPARVEKQLIDLRRSNVKDEPNSKTWHTLQPLKDVHFDTRYDNFDQRQAHIPTLYGLLAVAAFLLLLGCINFINLTTAQSATRAKEIGVRKTMGSSRVQLVVQFLGETFVVTTLATMLSILVSPLVLRVFSDYVPPTLTVNLQEQPHLLIFALILVLFVTVFAGLYPAFILSKYKPITVLKNQAFSGTARTRKAFVRKGLTITQFAIAQIFIIATIVVGNQIRYSLNKDMGFDKEAVVVINSPWNESDKTKKQVLLNELRTIPGIKKISLAGAPPASPGTATRTFKYNDGKQELETSVEIKYADSNYLDLYGMKLLVGRLPLQGDSVTECIINQNYATFLGFKDPSDAVGIIVNDFRVVGVLPDFHTKGTQVPIKPLAYLFDVSQSTFHLKLAASIDQSTKTWTRTLDEVQAAYRKVYPEHDYDHYFFDEKIAAFYKKEQDIARFLTWASGLAIFISCLGLLGLVIFTTNQRIKEIGVRKVLGASVPQIVSLLSKDFLLLVVLAFLIAAPIAYYAMHSWLENFQYRTTISWWIFTVTGFGMMLIALLTLSLQTVKAARTNPVKNLRTE